MHASSSLSASPPTLVVDTGGAAINGIWRAFRALPGDGWSRKELAALLGLHHRSVKRLDLTGSVLREGRHEKNRRVVRYPAAAIVDFLTQTKRAIDVCAALDFGFPFSMVRSEQLCVSIRPPTRLGRGYAFLAPLTAAQAQDLCRAYLAWRAVEDPTPPSKPHTPALLELGLNHTAMIGFAALTEAVLPKSRCTAWAAALGRSPAQVRIFVADAAQILRAKLDTALGQQLLAALLQAPSPPKEQTPPRGSVLGSMTFGHRNGENRAN